MSKLSDLKLNKLWKILLIGDSGAGKTCFSTGLGKRVWLADFDGKASSAAAYHPDEHLAGIDFEDYSQLSVEKLLPAEHFNKKLGEFAKQDPFPYDTIVVDSLTLFSDRAIEYLMKVNPGIKRTAVKAVVIPGLQDYQMLRIFMKQIITAILALPCNVIVTGHIETTKDEMTGQILRNPMISGKLSKELPIFFEEVWRGYVDKDGKHMLQTRSDNKYNLRTQIGAMPKDIPMNWDEVMKYV